MPSSDAPRMDLLILAGGRGSRLGGADKAALVVGGRSLVQRLLHDVDLGGAVVVVGTTPLRGVAGDRTVLQTLEDPPDGGPVAGIAAGLDALAPGTEWVAVAAVDQPQAARALGALAGEVAHVGAEVQAVSPVDATGHRQWLLAVYRRSALAAALGALPDVRDTSVRRLVSGLRWHEVAVDAGHLGDVDTWEDVEDWARRVAHDGVTGSC